MKSKTLTGAIEDQQWLDKPADILQNAVLKSFEAGGEGGKCTKNFLHGVWLGHPLHPILTDIPIGAWSAAAALDIAELCGSKKFSNGADAAIAIGVAGAVGAAVSGLTDWTGTSMKTRRLGLVHGILNIAATALYASSLSMRRKKKQRTKAIGLALLGYGISSLSAYLGGYMVYREQIGVDHTATAVEYPQEFTPVLAESELAEGSMRSVKLGDLPVLLAKQNDRIFAIADTCSHQGGPLAEGDLLEGNKVRCPWHGSVFSLESGAVEEGPATEPQPQFTVRVHNGQIEIKLNLPS